MLFDIYIDGVIVAFILVLFGASQKWDELKSENNIVFLFSMLSLFVVSSWIFVLFSLVVQLSKKAKNDSK